MRRSGARLGSRRFDSRALFFGFWLIVQRRREQRKLDRIDQGTQEFPGCRNVILRDVIQKDM